MFKNGLLKNPLQISTCSFFHKIYYSLMVLELYTVNLHIGQLYTPMHFKLRSKWLNHGQTKMSWFTNYFYYTLLLVSVYFCDKMFYFKLLIHSQSILKRNFTANSTVFAAYLIQIFFQSIFFFLNLNSLGDFVAQYENLSQDFLIVSRICIN